MRVFYKRVGEIYYIKDSKEGMLRLSNEKMQEDLDYVKLMGSSYDLIGYKNK